MSRVPSNDHFVSQLREASQLLALQGANPFRADAYRRAAEILEGLDESVVQLYGRGGEETLMALPGIGDGIAGALREMIETGSWAFLDRLRGAADPERRFLTLPGVGPELARRIHEELHVETLEALEIAAHDGRLSRVRGFGPRRVAGVRAALFERLGRRSRRGAHTPAPAVSLLLDVDREYREAADAGRLRTIAPRRFNPHGESWLPILHTTRGDWHFTVMFSNTARAHRLGRTRDWVVVYYYDHDHREGQATVVTERVGPLEGRRVVRGRESETPT